MLRATLNRTARRRVALLAFIGPLLVTPACTRTRAVETTPPPASVDAAVAPPHPPVDAAVVADQVLDAGPTIAPWMPPVPARIEGPREDLSLDAGRPVYYAFPREGTRPFRLVAHLHGMCGPPSYACGKWIGAGTDVGAMICPTGNARCGDSPYSPPSWEASTWPELVAQMDADLERSIAKVDARRPGTFHREGAILTGYSRGAYAAAPIARRHPGRWPYLVLIEANVPLTVEGLKKSGVRAVALVAGEQGLEIAGMRKTEAELVADGFPAKLFVMRRTGHPYSEDIEYVMHDALAYVLAQE